MKRKRAKPFLETKEQEKRYIKGKRQAGYNFSALLPWRRGNSGKVI